MPAAARVHDRDVAVAALATRAAATLGRDEFASGELGWSHPTSDSACCARELPADSAADQRNEITSPQHEQATFFRDRMGMTQWIRPGVLPVSRALLAPFGVPEMSCARGGPRVAAVVDELEPTDVEVAGVSGMALGLSSIPALSSTASLVRRDRPFSPDSELLGLPYGLAGSCRSLRWARMCEVVHTEILGAVRQRAYLK
jgi:hypothetical protein